MSDTVEVVLGFLIFLTLPTMVGIFMGMSIADGDTNDKLCKQLYTNTTNYINCKSEHNLDKYIKRVKPIK